MSERHLRIRLRILQRRDGTWWKTWTWRGSLRSYVDRWGGKVIEARRDQE